MRFTLRSVLTFALAAGSLAATGPGWAKNTIPEIRGGGYPVAKIDWQDVLETLMGRRPPEPMICPMADPHDTRCPGGTAPDIQAPVESASLWKEGTFDSSGQLWMPVGTEGRGYNTWEEAGCDGPFNPKTAALCARLLVSDVSADGSVYGSAMNYGVVADDVAKYVNAWDGPDRLFLGGSRCYREVFCAEPPVLIPLN